MLEEKPERLTNTLSTYIAAQSRIRIARRFRNPHLSQPYYERLKGVGVIPPLSLDRKQAKDDRSDVDTDEFKNDRLFLKEFLGPYHKDNRAIGIPIDHILKKVGESQTGSGDIELYTDDTSTEFHELLLFLLHHFEESLQTLVPKNPSHSDPKPAAFKESVEKLAYYAYGLLRLARGRAFRMHLENIEKLLDDPRCPSAGPSTDDHEETAEEFAVVLLPQQKLKSYVAWLQLILGHFDAVEILSGFVKSSDFPYKSISIEILEPLSTNGETLDWRTIFSPQGGHFANPALDDFLNRGVLAVKDRNVPPGKRKKANKDAATLALTAKLEQHPSARNFFVNLGREQVSTGVIHCEAYLANHLNHTENLSPLQVKYISCHLSGPHFVFL